MLYTYAKSEFNAIFVCIRTISVKYGLFVLVLKAERSEKDDISGFDQHKKIAETAVVVSHIGGWDK